MKQILDVAIKNNLCTGCGTCVGLCPTGAIQMSVDSRHGIYLPYSTTNKCIDCGLCEKSCPGYYANDKRLETLVFGKNSSDFNLGTWQHCYVGHATNHSIRYNSASGGFTTAFLLFALENGLIDGALVTRMSNSDPFLPEPFIATTKEEIISATTSKYCPVPVNQALKQVLSKDGRYAVVGLPCHLAGIRKAEALNIQLKKRIVFHVGLLCSTNRSFYATDYLMRTFNIKKSNVRSLAYRGRGWMGGMTVKTKDGHTKFIPYNKYWSQVLRSYFIPIRCTYCGDETAELADVSFGDVWLPPYRSDKIGTSLCIVRNDACDAIMQSMRAEGYLEFDEVPRKIAANSQSCALTQKKIDIAARISIINKLGKRTPMITVQKAPTVGAYLHASSLYLQIFLSKNQAFWPLLNPISVVLEKIGSSI